MNLSEGVVMGLLLEANLEIVLGRFGTPLMLRFALRGPSDFVRFSARQSMARRRNGLANAVKHWTRLFLLLWRTSSRHIQPPLSFRGTGAMLAPPRNGVNKHTYSPCEDLLGVFSFYKLCRNALPERFAGTRIRLRYHSAFWREFLTRLWFLRGGASGIR